MTEDHNSEQKLKGQSKSKEFILDQIRRSIEYGSGFSIDKLKDEYAEDSFFYESLKHITTTKKALCQAVGIPVEAACRYKRLYEKCGLLWQVKHVYCPFTRHMAWTLTTDPDKAPKHNDTSSNGFIQTRLF